MSEPASNSDSETSPQPSNSSSIDTNSSVKPFVLVIDDSRLVRVTVRKTLAKEFTIIEAEDGEDGWEKLIAESRIQAVITDAGMPRLDGFGLIARIRDHDTVRINTIPIMMITGAESSETKVRERAFSLGATDFITKPFDKTQMLARVHGYTTLDQTQRTLETTEEALAEQSVIDSTTGIHNRRYFLQRGQQHLAFVKRHHQELSVIATGIDNFNKLQQSYGEDTANKVLSWAAALIDDIKRKEDVIAHVGNACFAIVAPTAGRMEAAVLGERIRKQFMALKFSDASISLSITVSSGLSCTGKEASESVDDLLALAEARVKQAQQLGGNRTIASTKNSKKHTLPISTPSIDVALKHISTGRSDKLKPFLAIMAKRILPLLELCNEKLDWKIEEHIAAIKNKLEENN